MTDRGTGFIGKLLERLSQLLGVRKLRTSSFNPKCDGLNERLNSELWKGLRCYLKTDQADWSRHLQTVLFGLRATASREQFAPFQVLHGVPMRLPGESVQVCLEGPRNVDDYMVMMGKRLELLRQVTKDRSQVAKDRFKQQYDKHAKARHFDLGDKVWLQNATVQPGKSKKLLPKFLGPYYITEKIGEATYRLRDAETQAVQRHPVHVDRLRPFVDMTEMSSYAKPDVEVVEAEATEVVDDQADGKEEVKDE